MLSAFTIKFDVERSTESTFEEKLSNYIVAESQLIANVVPTNVNMPNYNLLPLSMKKVISYCNDKQQMTQHRLHVTNLVFRYISSKGITHCNIAVRLGSESKVLRETDSTDTHLKGKGSGGGNGAALAMTADHTSGSSQAKNLEISRGEDGITGIDFDRVPLNELCKHTMFREISEIAINNYRQGKSMCTIFTLL
jgi:hypothetical protein